jgi:mono/diheme cytochrome c family protein
MTAQSMQTCLKDLHRPSYHSLSGTSVCLSLIVLTQSFLFSACEWKDSSRPPRPEDLLSPALKASYERGRSLYQTHCTACHHSDPKRPGSIGPDVFGSSAELITARVLYGTYPPGYRPKRETHQMAALPFLKDEIPALSTYLNPPAPPAPAASPISQSQALDQKTGP